MLPVTRPGIANRERFEPTSWLELGRLPGGQLAAGFNDEDERYWSLNHAAVCRVPVKGMPSLYGPGTSTDTGPNEAPVKKEQGCVNEQKASTGQSWYKR